MLNSLANHGYLPRDGRSIRVDELTAAMHDVVGLSSALAPCSVTQSSWSTSNLRVMQPRRRRRRHAHVGGVSAFR